MSLKNTSPAGKGKPNAKQESSAAKERIANLQNGEALQNDRLDEIEEHLDQIDHLLEGRPDDKNDNGLKGDIHEIAVGLNSLRALMQPDSLGAGGVIHRLKALEKKAGFDEKREEYRWKFWLALIGFVSAATVAVISNLDRIEAFLNRHDKPDKVSQMIENAKHPRPRHRHIKIVIPPETQEDSKE